VGRASNNDPAQDLHTLKSSPGQRMTRRYRQTGRDGILGGI